MMDIELWRVRMPSLHVCVVIVCWSLAVQLFLQGCGDESFTSIAPPAEKGYGPTSIIVMRHCGRSESDNNIRVDLQAWLGIGVNVDRYSSEPWPKFPVKAFNCLKRGSDIIEAQGNWYRSAGNLPRPISGIADNASRNIESMHRFTKGFAESMTTTVDTSPYTPASTEACEKAKPGGIAFWESAKAHMEQNPPPEGNSAYEKMLFDAMGVGENDWRGKGCFYYSLISPPYPMGTCQAAGNFAARVMAEWIGGMEVLWGHVKAIDIPKLMNLHSWHFFQWWGPELTARYYGASMAKAISTKLMEGVKGTTMYFGHDSDIMMLKSMLGVSWDPMPFAAVNDTSPGSMLRFDMQDGKVNISFWYVKNFGEDDGAMSSLQVATGLRAIEVFDRLQKGDLVSCANPVSSSMSMQFSATSGMSDRLEEIRREHFSTVDLDSFPRLCLGLFTFGASTLLACALICRRSLGEQNNIDAYSDYSALLDGA